MSEAELKMERWRFPRFFTENISETTAVLSGEDSKHAVQVLRMREGDHAVICDGKGMDYLAVLEHSGAECVFRVLESSHNEAEPDVRVRLFQAMPKSDKMEFIVQKAVECGACEIVPFFSKRCVSRPDKKQMAKKTERYRRIAYEAAKQCGRGVIPVIGEAVEFSDVLNMFSEENTGILFYECAQLPLREAVPQFKENIDIIIGSEGGFEESEAAKLAERGFIPVSLGKRILRCETAPIAAISVLMNMTGNM
ncbi:MAG: 16S rRNA (uracil(1498)-N(3))-methyltransferase [Ruminococcaceae bacterium]|nr:16S rRNA (uracil(1498)-N(3))-methyltransferase [Oscillospiraceae bacterium]